jgi:peptidylprolyl isomerase
MMPVRLCCLSLLSMLVAFSAVGCSSGRREGEQARTVRVTTTAPAPTTTTTPLQQTAAAPPATGDRDGDGRLDSGDVFDTNEDGSGALQFQVGAGQVIPGFDAGVRGMVVGDKKSIEIEADDAYGQRVDALVNSVPREGINLGDTQPEVGMNLVMHIADDQQIPVTITDVTDTHITLDANHPLAGEKLIFEVERVE